MIQFKKSILAFMFVLISPHAFGLTLSDRIELEQKSYRSQLTEEVRDQIFSHHLVLVAGVMNELASITQSYFNHAKVAAQESAMTFSQINPPSWRAVSENAEFLYRRLILGDPSSKNPTERVGIYSYYGKKPLVLVGHSKGGAEVLLMLLRHPELLVKGIVDRVVLLQAAIGGSPLAEPSHQRWLTWGALALLHSGIQSLQPDEIQPVFQFALEDALPARLGKLSSELGVDSTELFREVSQRVFYVIADKSEAQIGFGIGLVLAVVGDSLDRYGPNDGLVLVKDQVLLGQRDEIALGRVLGTLAVDHIGTSVGHFSATQAGYQRAFLNALFAHIFQPLGHIEEDLSSLELVHQQCFRSYGDE